MNDAKDTMKRQRVFKSLDEVQRVFFPSVVKEQQATENEEHLLVISRKMADQAFRRPVTASRPSRSSERSE